MPINNRPCTRWCLGGQRTSQPSLLRLVGEEMLRVDKPYTDIHPFLQIESFEMVQRRHVPSCVKE